MPQPDVLVIGGGPAGSTTATMLTRKGWTVRLFEREQFPREHIGESLLPASLPVLKDLGVLPAVEAAGYTKKLGATMVWGKDTEPWSWYFAETNRTYPHSYQVWRPHFDQLLLDNAAANGVEVLQRHRVLEVLFDGDRATGLRIAGPDGSTWTEEAKFIVDCSGQSGIIGRALKLRQPDSSFQNLAIYAYFEGAQHLDPPDEGNILVESYPNGWFWDIPLSNGWMSVGAVVDHTAGQEGIRRLGPEAYLREQIAATAKTRLMLEAATMVSGPVILRDWSYRSRAVAGDGWVLAGDSACFIDPLFSSGVQLALSSGVLASAYVTSTLRDPSIRESAARVYQDLYYQQYGHFREMARLFYSSNLSTDSYFWEARRLLGRDDSLSPRQSFIQAVAGQPPQGYERVVLERGHAPEDFVSEVRSAESSRARRTAYADEVVGDMARLAAAVPVRSESAVLEKSAVLGDGEFEWGYLVRTPSRPEGLPLSSAAAKFLTLIDGQRTAEQAVAELIAGLPANAARSLAKAAVGVLKVFYVEGLVSELEPGVRVDG